MSQDAGVLHLGCRTVLQMHIRLMNRAFHRSARISLVIPYNGEQLSLPVNKGGVGGMPITELEHWSLPNEPDLTERWELRFEDPPRAIRGGSDIPTQR